LSAPRAGLWLALLVPLSAAADEVPPETLLGCRAIADGAERLACYDRVVDRARTVLKADAPGVPRSSSPEHAAASQGEPAAPGEGAFGRAPGQQDRALRETLGAPEAPDSIESIVTAVTRGGDRRLTIVLDNGQTWKQEEFAAFALGVGDPVEIHARLLGAYYLRKGGKGREIRVERLR
jgi:hypothetical protein